MSEDIDFSDWLKISKFISENISKYEGIVMTMGTDTLHYTAAALSFLLKDIGKPVIITGAQRSIDRGSSDAFMNLICSVNAVTNIDCSGVFTCLHGTISDDYCLLINGTKVRKMHTSRRDAFRPINDNALAKIYLDGKIEILTNNMKKKSDAVPKITKSFEEKTALLFIHPGMDPDIINYYIKNKYKGIVLSGTALGHVPTLGKKSFMSVLKKAIDNGISIVISSQTLYGRTHPFVYTNLRKLSIELNCTFAEDIIPEVAFVKLAWILSQTTDKMKVKEFMQTNIAGEINKRHDDKIFLN